MTAVSRWVTCLMSAILVTGAIAEAGSLWAKTSVRNRPLHADDTARQTGDVLTIVIDERSIIENETTRGMAKKSERNASVAGNLDILGAIDKFTGELFSIPDMSLDMKAETKFDGSADYDSDRKVLDQITVTVADILPNGNLVVVGSRERETAGDKQILQVSGVVRPSDIAFDNTVQSDKVAEYKIVTANKGREKRFTRPGWLDRLLNIVNPF